MKDKNVVFMGTPDFAVPVLEMLIKNVNVVGVVTQPDKLVGRKKELVYTPVKEVAIKHNIEVFQPSKIRNEYDFLLNKNIDLIVTCAYGQILPKSVLDIPKYGCVNVHASILPKYRGSAPIQWALFNGDEKTGITIMYMDEGMDTGDIIKISEVNIDASDNVGTMHDKLSLLGSKTLESVLPTLFSDDVKRIKQGDDFTLAPMIKREDEKLDFNASGKDIINKIRGLNPWPLANVIINDLEIKVLEAEFKAQKVMEAGLVLIDKNSLGITCLDGVIYLKIIKPSGKKNMDVKSFLNGCKKELYENVKVM